MDMPLSDRNVIVAIDDSENAEFAFDCGYMYSFVYIYSFLSQYHTNNSVRLCINIF